MQVGSRFWSMANSDTTSENQPFPIQCHTDLYRVTEPTERFPLIQGFTECTESVLLCTDLYTHLPFVQV